MPITKCEYLQNRISECVTKALNSGDEKLKQFFVNAATGFTARLQKLTVKELGEPQEEA